MEKILNGQVLSYQANIGVTNLSSSIWILPGHSTVTQLCFLAHKWQMALERGEHIQATFLDLSKAYDRVSVPGLIFKLSCLGFSRDSSTWLSNFLADRQQCINVNGYKFPWKSPKSGIPQGTVLSPVLFLVFINDLPSVMKSFCSILADDTTAYTIGKDVASTCSDLSKDLDAASGWARTWGMLFNPEKSKHLAIKATDSTVSMDGICLPKITTHSHLGVTVNEKLTWDDHVSRLYTDCVRHIGILRRLRNKLNSTAFRKIFIGAIRPKIEYACAVWSGGPTGKIAKLQDAYCRRHQIHLTPLKKRFEYHTLTLFFKMKHQMVPQYLSSLVPAPTSESSRYSFRKLSYPVPLISKTSTLNNFLPRAIILWNSLPVAFQDIKTLAHFKFQLKSLLFELNWIEYIYFTRITR